MPLCNLLPMAEHAHSKEADGETDTVERACIIFGIGRKLGAPAFRLRDSRVAEILGGGRKRACGPGAIASARKQNKKKRLHHANATESEDEASRQGTVMWAAPGYWQIFLHPNVISTESLAKEGGGDPGHRHLHRFYHGFHDRGEVSLQEQHPAPLSGRLKFSSFRSAFAG